MKQRIYHVDVGKVEVYQFFCEVWRREIIFDRTKVGGDCQMDAFPFQFPLEDRRELGDRMGGEIGGYSPEKGDPSRSGDGPWETFLGLEDVLLVVDPAESLPLCVGTSRTRWGLLSGCQHSSRTIAILGPRRRRHHLCLFRHPNGLGCPTYASRTRTEGSHRLKRADPLVEHPKTFDGT